MRMQSAVNLNKYLSEGLGTFGLVFFGTLAIEVGSLFGAIDNVGIGLVFGLVVMTMIYAFGHTSGAHINPAVTLAFYLCKDFPLKQVFPYILFQIAGAILASMAVKFVIPSSINLGATLPTYSWQSTFFMEGIMSMFLMLVIFHVSKGSKETGILAGIAIGGIVAIEAIVGGPLTGASMNPARSIGPALVSGNLEHLWIYILAPITGTLLSIPIWNLTKRKTTN